MRRSHSRTASSTPPKRLHRPLRALAVLGVLFALAAGDAAARPASTYNPNGPATGQPSTIVRVVAPSNGFDWGDAAIGAAAGLGISLVALGGGIAASRRRDHRPAMPAAPVS
jgi:hypothetical protein